MHSHEPPIFHTKFTAKYTRTRNNVTPKSRKISRELLILDTFRQIGLTHGNNKILYISSYYMYGVIRPGAIFKGWKFDVNKQTLEISRGLY